MDVVAQLYSVHRQDISISRARDWRDRNLQFHEYKRNAPTKNVQALLDHIKTSGDLIFWG